MANLQIKNIGPNQVEVTENNPGGIYTRTLFSYDMPVAEYIRDGNDTHVVVTEIKWSNTTSKHINSWLKQFAGTTIIYVPQKYFGVGADFDL